MGLIRGDISPATQRTLGTCFSILKDQPCNERHLEFDEYIVRASNLAHLRTICSLFLLVNQSSGGQTVKNYGISQSPRCSRPCQVALLSTFLPPTILFSLPVHDPTRIFPATLVRVLLVTHVSCNCSCVFGCGYRWSAAEQSLSQSYSVKAYIYFVTRGRYC